MFSRMPTKHLLEYACLAELWFMRLLENFSKPDQAARFPHYLSPYLLLNVYRREFSGSLFGSST